jgi:hypothetical protein
MFVFLGLESVSAFDAAPSKKFKSCTELPKTYPKGVVLMKATATKSDAKCAFASYYVLTRA